MALDVLLQYLPDRGVYDLVKGDDGNPKTTDAEQHAVLTQLLEGRGSPGVPGWAWDSRAGSGVPNTHGSLLYLITEDTAEQRKLAAIYAVEALQPLVDEQRITNVQADVLPALDAGRLDLVVNWDTPAGGAGSARIPIRFP